ncbi:hypothetical protein BKA65DRAFT_482766 [Rhexocercosporidium sp. MPI-PUGE-AT-0058]|nr:hypothetical protein BKA65DRAFT_482766 [Rhexocercosporidium sp. MPI-PUGE-AT-0058]
METLMNTSQHMNEPEQHRLFDKLHGATEHPSRDSKCGVSGHFSRGQRWARRPLTGTKGWAGFGFGVGIVNGGRGSCEKTWTGDAGELSDRRAGTALLFVSPPARPGIAVASRWGNSLEKSRNGDDKREQSWEVSVFQSVSQTFHIEGQSISLVDVGMLQSGGRVRSGREAPAQPLAELTLFDGMPSEDCLRAVRLIFVDRSGDTGRIATQVSQRRQPKCRDYDKSDQTTVLVLLDPAPWP